MSAARTARVHAAFLGTAGRKHVLHALGLALLLATTLSACATVAPYERERLARPDMQPGQNADAKAGAEHATAYREGSSGGLGASGGGCGCN